MLNILEIMSRTYRENFWSEDILFVVQEVIGPVYTWPLYIKNIIRSRSFRYSERVKLTTFFFVNGFQDSESWLKFVIRVKGVYCQKYRNDLNHLLIYYMRDDIQCTYFSYCTTHKRYEFLNGSPRQPRKQ